jgi:Uma2 family endonuclease
VIRADHVPGPPQGSWTYEEYAALPEDGKRYQVVDGVLYRIPTPTTMHQLVLGEFLYALGTVVEENDLGRIWPGPLDMLLGPRDVVQPEIVVILKAHQDRIAEHAILAAPDLIVEIIEPNTDDYDLNTKLPVYERSGVAEVWLVHREAMLVELLVNEDGKFRSVGVYGGSEVIPSRVIPPFDLTQREFFQDAVWPPSFLQDRGGDVTD